MLCFAVLGTGFSVNHRLTAVHHRPDFSDLDSVVRPGDGRPLGLSVAVGAAEAGCVGDVRLHFASLHPDPTGVVGRDGELHGDGVAERLHHGGSPGELQRLLTAQLDAAFADEGDFGGDAAHDAQHGGSTDVPGGLHFCGLGDGYRLHHRLALVVGDPRDAHGLRGILEELGLVNAILDVADVLGVGVPVDGQHLVFLVPILISFPGQEESFKLRDDLSETILVLPHVDTNTRAGPDCVLGNRAIGTFLPLQELKVVFVCQDLELRGVVLAVPVGVAAVGTQAGVVEAGLAVVLADVVGAFGVAVVDRDSTVGQSAVPGEPLQVNVVAKNVREKLVLMLLQVRRSQGSADGVVTLRFGLQTLQLWV